MDATADAVADVAIDHVRIPYDSGQPASTPRVPVVAELVSDHVDTRGLMLAAGEMQNQRRAVRGVLRRAEPQ